MAPNDSSFGNRPDPSGIHPSIAFYDEVEKQQQDATENMQYNAADSELRLGHK